MKEHSLFMNTLRLLAAANTVLAVIYSWQIGGFDWVGFALAGLCWSIYGLYRVRGVQ